MSQTMTGVTLMNTAPVHSRCSTFHSAAAHLASARRPSVRIRSNTGSGINGASDHTDESKPAQPEERFVSVSELLAEVRASHFAEHLVLSFVFDQQILSMVSSELAFHSLCRSKIWEKTLCLKTTMRAQTFGDMSRGSVHKVPQVRLLRSN